MTIILQPSLPGAKAYGRAKTPLVASPDPRLPAIDTAVYPNANVKGNRANGRRGQVMVVDRLDISGIIGRENMSGEGGTALFALRASNFDDTAGEQILLPLFGYDGYVLVDSGTVNAAGTTTTNIVSNEALVASAHIGRRLVLTSGALSGESRLISANTTTAFTTAAFSGTPAGAVTYEVRDYARTRRWFNWSIDKLGFVPQSSNLRTGVATPVEGQDYPNWLGFGQFTAFQTLAELDADVHLRYLSKAGAETQGQRIGGWAGAQPVNTTPIGMLAAPGAGLHYRIRTLLIIGCGQTNATHRITLGANATPANATIFEWYASPGDDGFRIEQFLTDLDIPTPANTPIFLVADGDYSVGGVLPRIGVVVGCEVAMTARQNFLNLTGVPA